MDLIPLPDVLKEMETGNSFSISFVTADRKRNSGGKVVTVPVAVLSKKGSTESTDTFPSASLRGTKQSHYSNSTRNIVIVPSTQIRKLHIRLITRFNGKHVRW